MNINLPYGKSLDITFNEEKLKNYDSIVVRKDQKLLDKLINKFSYSVNTSQYGLGYQKLEVSVYKKGKVRTIDLPFIMVSDVVPSELLFTKLEPLPMMPNLIHKGLRFTTTFYMKVVVNMAHHLSEKLI
jgi:hypothetical protein